METITITIDKKEVQTIINILLDSQVYQCSQIRQAKDVLESKEFEDKKGHIKLQIEKSEYKYSLCEKLIQDLNAPQYIVSD